MEQVEQKEKKINDSMTKTIIASQLYLMNDDRWIFWHLPKTFDSFSFPNNIVTKYVVKISVCIPESVYKMEITYIITTTEKKNYILILILQSKYLLVAKL